MTTATRFPRMCPSSKQQFRTHAPAGTEVVAKIAEGIDLTAKEFSTGGFGYVDCGKIVLDIDGVPVKCRVMISASVIDSNHAEDADSQVR